MKNEMTCPVCSAKVAPGMWKDCVDPACPLPLPTPAQQPAETVAKAPALEALVAACEAEFLTDDDDDEDISWPACGVTMGMIRAARKELDLLKGKLNAE